MSETRLTKAQEFDERAFIRNALKRVNRARRFPENTDPFVRHVEIIAHALATGKPYPMIDEEPLHVAGSLLVTIEHLYKARNRIADSLTERER